MVKVAAWIATTPTRNHDAVSKGSANMNFFDKIYIQEKIFWKLFKIASRYKKIFGASQRNSFIISQNNYRESYVIPRYIWKKEKKNQFFVNFIKTLVRFEILIGGGGGWL